MKFSTKVRYALRLMIDITNAGKNENVSLKDISERQRISVKYLEQIVPLLVRAGLLKSARGPQGGYRLSKNASECTAGEVIRAIEGKISVVACLEDSQNACPFVDTCKTIDFWEGLNATVSTYIDSISLQDLAHKKRLSH